MKERILLIIRLGQSCEAVEQAMQYAHDNGCALVVLFILDSHLFHYGRNDVVVPGYARSQFLFHIRLDLLRQAYEREVVMKEKAASMGLKLHVLMAEIDDFEETMIREASKGYRRIFVPREKKKRLPLFGNHTIQEILSRKGFANIISC